MSRLRANGLMKSAAFQSPTTTGEDAPMPSWKRPGAASASAAAVIASRPGPAGEDRGDRGAQPQPGLPGGGERQRGESVGAGHLG